MVMLWGVNPHFLRDTTPWEAVLLSLSPSSCDFVCKRFVLNTRPGCCVQGCASHELLTLAVDQICEAPGWDCPRDRCAAAPGASRRRGGTVSIRHFPPLLVNTGLI